MEKASDNDKVGHVDYELIPLRALNITCRRQLSLALLPERPIPTSTGITRDWQGLAELAGLSYDLILLFKRRDEPVLAMLDHWSQQQPTVAELIKYLELMERFDVIDDIQPSMEKDSLAFLRSQERLRQPSESLNSLNKNTYSEAPTIRVPPISIGDVENDQYDAYVSYMDSDIDFVEQLVKEMEGNFNLRLFIKERDMLPGVVEAEADLCMINERCKKILLVVSQQSLLDPHCEFHAVVAQASAVDSNLYSKKVIPIICKPCVLPSRYKYLARLDYTKQHLFGSFWKRLYYSIQTDQPETYVPSTTGYSQYMTTESSTVGSTNSLSTVNDSSTSRSALALNLPYVRDRTMSVPDLRANTVANGTSNDESPPIARSVTPNPDSSAGIAEKTPDNRPSSSTSKSGKKKSPSTVKTLIFKTTGFFSRGAS